QSGLRERHVARLLAVELRAQPALALGDHEAGAGLVAELDRIVASGGRPGLPRRASGKDFLRGRGDERAGLVRGADRGHGVGEREGDILAQQRLLDRLLGGAVLALAEVRPSERAAAPPEEQRRPALAAVVVPDQVL